MTTAGNQLRLQKILNYAVLNEGTCFAKEEFRLSKADPIS